MKKSVLTLILFLFTIINTISGQEIDTFLGKIDGASLEELEQELDEGITGLKSFMDFFTAPNEETKTFTAEEERFSEPFKIDTSIVQRVTKQFEKIGFLQTFKENKSHLEFEKIGDDYWNTVSLPEGMEERFTPKKIYYKDGTTTSVGIGENEVSFFWEKEWGAIKVIDSVEIDYNIRYTKTYDSLKLQKKTKKLNYKNGIVKIEKLKENYLYITISDAYSDGFYLRALNSDGKPLSQSSSSFSPTSDASSSDGMTAMLSLLEDVQNRLKKKKFKDVEGLKNYLIKKFSKLEATKDKDEVRHLKFYFDGNIDSAQLYFETEEGSQTVPFTATNNGDFKKILLMQTKEHIIFMNALANEIFRIDARPLERIGDRFFVENETYLHLNLANKSLDSLEAIKVFETINGLAFIQKEISDGFIVYDTNLKKLSEIPFSNVWSVDKEYAHTLSHDKENYAIDSKGTLKKIKGIDQILDLSEGLLMAKSNGKFGFIDVSGEIKIPCIYNDAELFSEGLAVVMNEEGQYGFINAKGMIALPLIYNRANSFENGIALVSEGNEY